MTVVCTPYSEECHAKTNQMGLGHHGQHQGTCVFCNSFDWIKAQTKQIFHLGSLSLLVSSWILSHWSNVKTTHFWDTWSLSILNCVYISIYIQQRIEKHNIERAHKPGRRTHNTSVQHLYACHFEGLILLEIAPPVRI